MKQKTFFTMLFMLYSLIQLQAQQTVAVAGGDATGSTGKISYSIGQTGYSSTSGSNGSSSQGVQQAFEISTLGANSFPEIILSMVVYPNPTTTVVNLKIENYNYQSLAYELYNINGKLLDYKKIDNNQTAIQMEDLAPAIYFLKISEENELIKTFKIIKNN
jgi:Secretion system C-terminal sorting domain